MHSARRSRAMGCRHAVMGVRSPAGLGGRGYSGGRRRRRRSGVLLPRAVARLLFHAGWRGGRSLAVRRPACGARPESRRSGPGSLARLTVVSRGHTHRVRRADAAGRGQDARAVRDGAPMGVAAPVADRVAVVPGFANVIAFQTADGLVLVDTGLHADGAGHVRRRPRMVRRPGSVAVFTHGHVDHVSGMAPYDQEAAPNGWRAPVVVAHEAWPPASSATPGPPAITR